MDTMVYSMTSDVNKHNHAKLEVYEDHLVIRTSCTGGLIPVYTNETREIPFSQIEKVIISKGGIKLFAHHPNCIHFVVRGSTRTIDAMYRDPHFHASSYIDEGVFQLAPKTETELDEKLDMAKKIRDWIESHMTA